MLIKRGRRVLAIAMAQNNFSGVWAHIFLDCVQCDQSIGLKFDNSKEADNTLDVAAAAIFNREGWTIKPTLCPLCLAKIVQYKRCKMKGQVQMAEPLDITWLEMAWMEYLSSAPASEIADTLAMLMGRDMGRVLQEIRILRTQVEGLQATLEEERQKRQELEFNYMMDVEV